MTSFLGPNLPIASALQYRVLICSLHGSNRGMIPGIQWGRATEWQVTGGERPLAEQRDEVTEVRI